MAGKHSGVVVVTGASSGIGAASASFLGALGYRVLAGVRRPTDAERLAADPSGRVTPLQLDVTSPADVAALPDAVERADAGRFAGLVNNAGIAIVAPVEALSLDDWRQQLEVNLLGQVAVTQALLPALRRDQGRVVNVSSIGGRVAAPLFGPYAASKFALEAFTDVLRLELRPFGVHVSAVEPGAIATPIWDKGLAEADARIADGDPDTLSRYADLISRGRRAAKWSAENGLPAATVAETVATALTAARPRARYLVGRDARLQAAASRLLPDRAMDALVLRAFR